ncbi:hypothetical protein ACZ90_18105 [Streptomyces albus subsp. albus]|nr:hypothetical protein ACZ90_18105 [Streptomyces albus subsp. albus]
MAVAGGSHDDECRAVEGRIAEALSRLARPRQVAGDLVAPPAYVRRHAVEHAAAAGNVDAKLISPDFLPYVDAERLRSLNPTAANARTRDVLRLWRQAAHGWEWDSPEANASSLAFWARCAGTPLPRTALAGHWTAQWAQWPLGNGEILARLPVSVGAVATAVLPDGRIVVVVSSDDGQVRVWDLITGHPIGEPVTVAENYTRPIATAVLPDGRAVVVAGTSRGLWVWDPAEGGPSGEPVEGSAAWAASLATTVLPDRRVVAIVGDGLGRVHLWDITTGRPEARPFRTIRAHSHFVADLCVTTLPDGRAGLLTASDHRDSTVRVWDLATGEPAAAPLEHNGRVQAMTAARLPDGRTIAVVGAGSRDRHVWDLATGSRTDTSSWTQAMATAVLPDGHALVVEAAGDYSLRVWDPSDENPVSRPLTGHTDVVRAVTTVTRPDGRVMVVSGGVDGTVRCWDLDTGPHLGGTTLEYGYPLSSVVATKLSDGRGVVVAGGRDMRTAHLADLADGDPVGDPLHHRDRVLALATAELPDGRTAVLAGGRDNEATVLVWDVDEAAAEGRVLSRGASIVLTTARLPGGRPVMITGHFIHRRPKAAAALRVRDLVTGEAIGEPLTSPAESVEAAATATSADGSALLIAGTQHIDSGESALRVWDLATGHLHGSLTGCTDTVSAVAAVTRQDGRTVAVTGEPDGTVRLWDLAERSLIGRHRVHSHAVQAIATATLSDGRAVAVTGGDATLWLWDLSSWEPIGPPLRLPGRVYALATARLDGRTVAAVAGDGLAVVHLEPTMCEGTEG